MIYIYADTEDLDGVHVDGDVKRFLPTQNYVDEDDPGLPCYVACGDGTLLRVHATRIEVIVEGQSFVRVLPSLEEQTNLADPDGEELEDYIAPPDDARGWANHPTSQCAVLLGSVRWVMPGQEVARR